ncbi:virulence factor MVIN family protein [Caballeronia fortuita]|uniref:Virulence factor MVIN family protein n=1 Tax=Caballeronia fortuita TaxID=1777138 RepID=A0A157Z1A5_9BURK|nr:lipid II flippase MurJ [Caballeronia fortuita]SAK39316.1 virulence factor MVIN family protein [Caballeronia fortuita]
MSSNLVARVRARFSDAHPDHRRIAKGAAWVSIFVLMGKSAGALKEMAIAYRYGVSGIVDAYQLSFTLVSWIPSMFVTVFSTVLIPMLVRLHDADSRQNAEFIGELRGMACIAGLLMATALSFAAPAVIGQFGATLPVQTRVLVGQFLIGLAPLAPLMLLMCIDAARLQARERHINTLLEALPAGVLFFVVVLSTGSSIAPLCLAVTLGLALQVFLLAHFASRADHVRARIKFGLASPHWRLMARSVGILLVSQTVLACIVPIDQYMATRHGGGAVATLGYANRLMSLLLGLGASAIGRATLPVLTRTIRNGERERARTMALKWAYVMFGVGTVAACLASIGAPWIVRLLFQRGAFTEIDSEHVASLLRWFTLQLAPSFATLVLMQMAASESRYRAIAVITLAGFVAKVAGNMIWTPWMGLAALPLGTATMSAVSLAGYLILFNARAVKTFASAPK